MGKFYTDYSLDLGVVINGEKETIWNKNYQGNFRSYKSFRVILQNNRKNYTKPPFFKQLEQFEKQPIDTINDMNFYRKDNRVVGELSNERDGLNSPPLIKCTIKPEKNINQVFTILESKEQKNISCHFSWMLNKDISVHSYPNSVDVKDAYHFKDIYQVINQGLKEAIHRKGTDFEQWLNNLNLG